MVIDPKMPAVVFYPHPRYRGPFSKEVEFNSGVKRTMMSADLVWLFVSMETSPVASVSSQDMRCTGFVDGISRQDMQDGNLGQPGAPE